MGDLRWDAVSEVARGPRSTSRAIADRVDLRRLVEADLGPPAKGRRWACPFHTDAENPNFGISPGRPALAVLELRAERRRGRLRRPSRRDHGGRGRPPARPVLGRPAGTQGEPGRPPRPRQAAPRPRPGRMPTGNVRSTRSSAGPRRRFGRRPAAPRSTGSGPGGWPTRPSRGSASASCPEGAESVPLAVVPKNEWNPDGRIRAPRGVTIPWVRPESWYAPGDDRFADPGPRWVGCNVRRLAHGDVSAPLPGKAAKYRALEASERGHAYPFCRPRPRRPAPCSARASSTPCSPGRKPDGSSTR